MADVVKQHGGAVTAFPKVRPVTVADVMEALEIRVLEGLGIADPYAAPRTEASDAR